MRTFFAYVSQHTKCNLKKANLFLSYSYTANTFIEVEHQYTHWLNESANKWWKAHYGHLTMNCLRNSKKRTTSPKPTPREKWISSPAVQNIKNEISHVRFILGDCGGKPLEPIGRYKSTNRGRKKAKCSPIDDPCHALSRNTPLDNRLSPFSLFAMALAYVIYSRICDAVITFCLQRKKKRTGRYACKLAILDGLMGQEPREKVRRFSCLQMIRLNSRCSKLKWIVLGIDFKLGR